MVFEAFKNLTGAGKTAAMIQILGVLIPLLGHLSSMVSTTDAAYVTFVVSVLTALYALLESQAGVALVKAKDERK